LGKQGRVGYEKNFLRFHFAETGNNLVAILTLSLIATITGILLSFYYEPGSGAYQALKWIDTEVTNGLLIHSIHDHAGIADCDRADSNCGDVF